MDATGSCKTSAYVVPMVIVLVLFLGVLGFALWYYFAQLKPRFDMLVMDKSSGSVGFKDATGAQFLLQPPVQAQSSGQSSRMTVVNPATKSNLNFSLYTSPIPGNTRSQVNLNVVSAQGQTAIPLIGA